MEQGTAWPDTEYRRKAAYRILAISKNEILETNTPTNETTLTIENPLEKFFHRLKARELCVLQV
jgi:hypothetical protein